MWLTENKTVLHNTKVFLHREKKSYFLTRVFLNQIYLFIIFVLFPASYSVRIFTPLRLRIKNTTPQPLNNNKTVPVALGCLVVSFPITPTLPRPGTYWRAGFVIFYSGLLGLEVNLTYFEVCGPLRAFTANLIHKFK